MLTTLKDAFMDTEWRVDAFINVLKNEDDEHLTVVELIDSVLNDPSVSPKTKAVAQKLDGWIRKEIERDWQENYADEIAHGFDQAEQDRTNNTWLTNASLSSAERAGT